MHASRAALGVAAGVVVAGLAWALIRDDVPAGSAQAEVPAGANAVAAPVASAAGSTAAGLEQARERNRQLEAENEWLRVQLEFLAGHASGGGRDDEPGANPDSTAADAAAGGRAADAEGRVASAEGSAAALDPEEKAVWFDDQALLRAGLSESDLERLREIFNASEMEILNLDHQARREGWYRKPRYWQTRSDQRLELREEIGDDSYDQLLYATGRPNRVTIDGVLDGSPGARAGLQPHDIVIGYDGSRVYSRGEFQRATTAGRLGDLVPLEVMRGGQRQRVFVPRGPIGVKLGQKILLPGIR